MKPIDLRRSPGVRLAETITRAAAAGARSRTGPSGVIDLGDGDTVWTDPDTGAQHSVKDESVKLADTQQQLDEARQDLDAMPALIDEAAMSIVTDQRLVAGSLSVWPFQPDTIPDGEVTGPKIADFSIAVTKFAANKTNHYIY